MLERWRTARNIFETDRGDSHKRRESTEAPAYAAVYLMILVEEWNRFGRFGKDKREANKRS